MIKNTEKTINKSEAAKKAAKKELREMNLLDNFLFGSVITYPEIGERFVRSLLKILLGKEFEHLSVTAQKVFYGTDSNLHGTRLDVYIEPEVEKQSEETATVYDIEPDKNSTVEDRKALPRRMRFYHAKIAAKSLNSGAGYDELKNVIIIMIMPYDPFGLNRMVYTVKNKCVEVPEMPYEDGSGTLFLYTKGTEGVPNEAVRQLLYYMENTVYENAVNEDLREIHRIVETVKEDSEIMLVHLRMQEEFKRKRAEGRAAGKAEGEFLNKITLICKKLKKNKTLEEIADDLEEDVFSIEPLYNMTKEFAPDYDPESILERLKIDNLNG